MFTQLKTVTKMQKDLKTVYAKKLEGLLPQITPSDKKEAIAALNISQPTLYKYLQGKVVKIDTASNLIVFFEGKIKSRKKSHAAA